MARGAGAMVAAAPLVMTEAIGWLVVWIEDGEDEVEWMPNPIFRRGVNVLPPRVSAVTSATEATALANARLSAVLTETDVHDRKPCCARLIRGRLEEKTDRCGYAS